MKVTVLSLVFKGIEQALAAQKAGGFAVTEKKVDDVEVWSGWRTRKSEELSG